MAFARPTAAQPLGAFGGPIYYSDYGSAVPPCSRVPGYFPGYAGYAAYPAYPYYPYPLPLAPSLGFGRGGIYGHQFVGRGERIFGFTLPGGSGE